MAGQELRWEEVTTKKHVGKKKAWENSRVMKLLCILMMVANTHIYVSAKTQRL